MIEQYKTQCLRPVDVLIVVLTCPFVAAAVPLACRKSSPVDSVAACAANLRTIGKATLIYTNDYDGKFPRSAGKNSEWNTRIQNWRAPNRFQAYGTSARGEGGIGNISSCFYLLVKYAGVKPKSFICPGDLGTSEFKPADDVEGDIELIDLWDFGITASQRCSYSYHMPFSEYALTRSSEPGMAVAADRNPFLSSPMADPKNISLFIPDAGRRAIKVGNAVQHQEEGQNVLFVDAHVSFEKIPHCGVHEDNIYTYWDGGDIRKGSAPVLGSKPIDQSDSLLVHDGRGFGRHEQDIPPPKGRACFLADTTVWVDGVLVPICSVVAGQAACTSLCAAPGQWPDRVEKVQEHTGAFECRDIVLESGNHIAVVGAHCFMLDSGQWIAAQNLTSDLALRTIRGSVRIRSVTVRPARYTGKVYNLKIKNEDKYAVGKDAVIVRDF